MSITTQIIIGLALLLVGWLLGRWAARYDVRSRLGDALWGVVLRGGWKHARKGDLAGAIDKDGRLRQQIKETADSFKADATRMGSARAAAKHGALFALAYAVNLATIPILLIGLLLLAHAAWRQFG